MKNRNITAGITYASVLYEAKDAYPAYNDRTAICEKLKSQICISKYCKTPEQVERCNLKIKKLKELRTLHLIRNN